MRSDLEKDFTERYRLALWATDTAIWDWDIERKLMWSSSGLQILYGAEESDITRHFDIEDADDTWVSRLHPEDRVQTLAEIRKHLENDARQGADTPFNFEYRYQWTGGEYIWLRAAGRTIRTADGEPLRMVRSNSDITTQKYAEMEAQRLREAVDNARGLRALRCR